jgi:uncharacterized protein
MARLFRSRNRRREKGPRVLFATDIHGSDTCWRKFLNASDVYGASLLILGGDITGKIVVPIERRGSTYVANFGGREYSDLDESGRRELVQTIRRVGQYPVVGTYDELKGLDDEAGRDGIFRKAVYDGVADWVALAEQRLRGTGKRLFMAPGNDDFLEIDEALGGSDVVEFVENRVVALTPEHEMLTTGYSNPTPWDTERELPEEGLRARLDIMAEKVAIPERLVAVIHPPPFNTPLDIAPAIDEEFRMSVGAHGLDMAPVGSTAVRAFIEELQPMLALHGHVHGSQGDHRLGRTLCLNPGSQYTEGRLAVALLELGPDSVVSYQFLTG